MNASSKRFKRYKFKSYKRKSKRNLDKKGDEFEQCAEDTNIYDMDGNSLEEKSGNDLVNSHRESKHEGGEEDATKHRSRKRENDLKAKTEGK